MRPGARRWDPASPARFIELFLCKRMNPLDRVWASCRRGISA